LISTSKVSSRRSLLHRDLAGELVEHRVLVVVGRDDDVDLAGGPVVPVIFVDPLNSSSAVTRSTVGSGVLKPARPTAVAVAVAARNVRRSMVSCQPNVK